MADTGSSALAVVGDPKLGCLHHLDTSDRCDTGRHVECLYGSGGWRGVDCHRDVAIGGLAVSGYELAAVTWEQAFLLCPRSPVDEHAPHPLRHDMLIEGIFGLSLFGLRGSTNTSVPLMHSLFQQHPRLRRSFGLQCCPFLLGSGKGGDGAMDIGGADPSHFHDGGEGFSYAAVVAQEFGYWGVDLTAVRLEGAAESLLRNKGDGTSTAIDAYGRAKYIVDSGTSLLLFRPPTYAALKAALVAAAGPKAPKAHHGFWKAEGCASTAQLDVDRLPAILLTLRGVRHGAEVTLRVPASRYLRRQQAAACAVAGGAGGGEEYWLGFAPIAEGNNGILGQILFEEYYVYHELGDDGLASSAPPPLSSSSRSSSSRSSSFFAAATAAAAAPPRIGFAPLAGCDAAAAAVVPSASLTVPAAAELARNPAEAPPMQASNEEWGRSGDSAEAKGAPSATAWFGEGRLLPLISFVLVGLLGATLALSVAFRSLRQTRAAACGGAAPSPTFKGVYSPFLQPDRSSASSWGEVDGYPDAYSSGRGMPSAVAGAMAGREITSEITGATTVPTIIHVPRAIRLVHPRLHDLTCDDSTDYVRM